MHIFLSNSLALKGWTKGNGHGNFGDGNLSEEFEPVHKYEPSDSLKHFEISLIAGESFCADTKIVTNTSVTTFVPNVISPNGDGKNDTFKITATDDIELYIYNRYGKEVYHSVNYGNKWNGGSLASGVYFYQLIFSDKNTRCNGWVEVLR